MIRIVLNNNADFIYLLARMVPGKSAKASPVITADKEYGREFYLHSQDELEYYSLGIFDDVKELLPDGKCDWKFCIFRKASG